MSNNRKQCFNSIVANSGVQVKLITDANLEEYDLPHLPIHPGIGLLSATHKSDYLRSYFMYHYGGGYTDIKPCNFNWAPYFDILNQSDKQFIGYQERCKEDIGYAPAVTEFNKLVGMCQYIFKPQTEIAKQWLDETNNKMNSILPELMHHHGLYHPRAIRGGAHDAPGLYTDSQYPLEWTELLGRIFHKIQYENMGKFLTSFPYPNVNNYR